MSALLVNPKRLVALVNDGYNTREKAASITGEHGSRVKEAKESGHLNLKVFGWMKQLDRMPSDDRDIAIELFSVYVDMLRDEKRWEHPTGDLFKYDPKKADEESDEPELPTEEERTEAAVSENVVRLQRGISKLEPEEDCADPLAIPAALDRRGGRGKKPAPVDANAALNEMTDAVH